MIPAEFDDGGRSRFGGGASVKDQREAIAELGENVNGAGATGTAGEIRTGTGERNAKFGDQIGDDTTIGPAEGDATGVGGNLQGKTIGSVDDNGERTRPAGLGETKEIVGEIAGEHLGVNERTDEDGERLGLRAALDAEDFIDGGKIDGISGKRIESIGGNCHDRAAVQPTGCVANDVRIRMRSVNLQNLC